MLEMLLLVYSTGKLKTCFACVFFLCALCVSCAPCDCVSPTGGSLSVTRFGCYSQGCFNVSKIQEINNSFQFLGAFIKYIYTTNIACMGVIELQGCVEGGCRHAHTATRDTSATRHTIGIMCLCCDSCICAGTTSTRPTIGHGLREIRNKSLIACFIACLLCWQDRSPRAPETLLCFVALFARPLYRNSQARYSFVVMMIDACGA